MNAETPRPSLARNWLSLAGLVIAVGSLFSFLLLFLLDEIAHLANPYVGILTFRAFARPSRWSSGFTGTTSFRR